MAFSEDLDEFINTDDFAVLAKFNGICGNVILDMPDEVIGGGEIISTEYRITYKTGLFPGLGYDSPITICGVHYTVRGTPRLIDDGAFSVVMLSRI